MQPRWLRRSILTSSQSRTAHRPDLLVHECVRLDTVRTGGAPMRIATSTPGGEVTGSMTPKPHLDRGWRGMKS